MGETEEIPPAVVTAPPYETTGTVQRAPRPAGGWTPTSDLRWNAAVLEQQWILTYHETSEIAFQWLPVPHA
jgi:hypothetical protein